MARFDAPDPDFEGSVRERFDRLTLMRTVGARLLSVAPGEVQIDLPFRVIRPGRTVSVGAGDVLVVRGEREKLVATMLATMATVGGEAGAVARAEVAVATAQHGPAGAHHPRGSAHDARPWCVCRGGGLRRRLRAIARR
jgi:hypothetical protein